MYSEGKMWRLGTSILVFVTGAALVLLLLNHYSNIKTGLNRSNNEHLKLTHRRTSEVITSTARKMKETNSMNRARSRTKIDSGNLNVEDYPHFDPTPNSKATIRNGPIEHGTPLMPYLPQPTPRGARKPGPGPHDQPVFPPPPSV